MAPAGPRVSVPLVPRKLFHFGVQGKRKLSLVPIVFFNRQNICGSPACQQIGFTSQLIYFLFVARKTTTSLRKDIRGTGMGVCRTGLPERDKYSRSVPGSWLCRQARKEYARRRYIFPACANISARRGRPTHRQR